jgi:hypothetical protein
LARGGSSSSALGGAAAVAAHVEPAGARPYVCQIAFMSDTTVTIAERLTLVRELLDQGQHRRDASNPYVRAALARETAALRLEKEKLETDLVASLQELLDATAGKVATVLDLTDQQAEEYRRMTVATPSQTLMHRHLGGPGFTKEDQIAELRNALAAEASLLRWVEQAKDSVVTEPSTRSRPLRSIPEARPLGSSPSPAARASSRCW